GSKLPAALFENTALRLIQITGAGVDRLDRAALEHMGIPVANVPGRSNSAVAEYVVTVASLLLRRFASADAEIKRGNYTSCRTRMLADNLSGLHGLLRYHRPRQNRPCGGAGIPKSRVPNWILRSRC